MNLNRGLAIKIVDSIESCENTIRFYYQGGIYKSVVDSEKQKDEEKEDTNKKVYFELPKILKKIIVNLDNLKIITLFVYIGKLIIILY